VDLTLRPDIVVLGPAVLPQDEAGDIAQLLKVPLTKDGFFLEAHMKLRPVDFATEGMFLAGGAHGPKSLEEAITQAMAAAGRAAALLSKDRLETEAMVSEVDLERCDGCAYCVEPCPFKAIKLVEYKDERTGNMHKHVEVNASLCKGCGVCMATCPKAAINIRGFTAEQIKAQMEAAIDDGKEKQGVGV
jgi:heterodisulfide reductase subunit A